MMETHGHNSRALSYRAPGIFQGTYVSKESFKPNGVFRSRDFYQRDFPFFCFSTVAEEIACSGTFDLQIVLKRTPTSRLYVCNVEK
jgi:hypothetical protein